MSRRHFTRSENAGKKDMTTSGTCGKLVLCGWDRTKKGDIENRGIFGCVNPHQTKHVFPPKVGLVHRNAACRMVRPTKISMNLSTWSCVRHCISTSVKQPLHQGTAAAHHGARKMMLANTRDA